MTCEDIAFPSRAQFITKLSEDTESISTVGYKFTYKDEQYGDYIILNGNSPAMVTEAKEQLVDRMCAVFAKLIKKDL